MTTRPHPIAEHLLIVGNGMASHRLIEALLKHPHRPPRITVIGAERVPAYNRILLSPLLAAELERSAVTLRDVEWYAEHGVRLILGERVETIDRRTRRVTTHRGRELAYDRLVLATGSRPTIPAIPGTDLSGVHVFRDLDDVAALTAAAEHGGHAVVIGGGLLGLEAAEGLRKRGHGMAVSVLQRSSQLMNRQLDATAAGLLANELEHRGLTLITGVRLAALEDDGNGHVSAVCCEDGRRIDADCVVIAAGITPNAELGRQAGLAVNSAVVVDDTLTSSDPAIHALGECCEHQGQTYGLVEPIWRQVDVLAAWLCADDQVCADDQDTRYVDVPCATKLKVSGISLYAFGPTDASLDHDVLSYHDPVLGEYRRLLLRDGRIDGAVLYGDTALGPWYFEQSLAGRDLSAARRTLLFGARDATPFIESPPSDTDFPPQENAA